MRIKVNGEEREVPQAITVARLLELLKVRTAAVAVEVNRQLVPKAKHADYVLQEGDEVEVVTLVGGGGN